MYEKYWYLGFVFVLEECLFGFEDVGIQCYIGLFEERGFVGIDLVLVDSGWCGEVCIGVECFFVFDVVGEFFGCVDFGEGDVGFLVVVEWEEFDYVLGVFEILCNDFVVY